MKESLINIYEKIKNFFIARKILSLLILIVLIFIFYKIFFSGNSSSQTTYNISNVSRETIVSYLSETGQVATGGNIDLKSSVSGKITSIKVQPGDSVKAGQIIATIESSTAYTNLESAKLSYKNAKLNYLKATSRASTSSILSAQNNLQNSSSSLVKAYNDSLSNISSLYSDMSTIISYLHDALYLSDINSSQYNVFYYSDTARSIEKMYSLSENSDTYLNDATNKYNLIKKDYDLAFTNYQSLSYISSNDDLYNGLQKANLVARQLSDSLKSAINLIQYYQDLNNKYSLTINSKSNTYLNNLKNYQNTINSSISTLVSNKSNIDSLKISILQQETNLQDLENGVSGIDLETAQISLDQARISYEVALNNYNNYFISSPIDGKIGSISAVIGGEASGSTIATVITESKFVDVSVSENDIVKIKVGQKANISFDAIDDLSLVGTVSQINISGSVSSGVVSYAVKIAFDDPSNQVRPGMSATANIIVGIATDVLSVPNTAVKSGTSVSYVDVFNSTSSLVENGSGSYISSILPTRKTVTLGLVGDTYTEITSGLDEGEIVVSKTNSASTVSKTSGTNSSSQKNNMGSGMGGMRF